MWSSSGGVTQPARRGPRRTTTSAPPARARAGVTSSASSKPRSRASRACEHVGRVGERLDRVQHPRGRVGDVGQSHRGRQLGQRLDQRQPPPAARVEDEAQERRRTAPALRQQRVDVGAQRRRGRHRQAQVGGRARHPLQMVVERERAPVVEAHAPRRRRRPAAAPRRSPGCVASAAAARTSVDHRCSARGIWAVKDSNLQP